MEPLQESIRVHDETLRRIGDGFASALDWTKGIGVPREHLDAIAVLGSNLAGSGMLDQLKELSSLTDQWHGVLEQIGNVTKLVPPETFGNVGRLAESLCGAMPTLPMLDREIFGGAWNDKVAAAFERLRQRAEEVANDPDAGAEDVAEVVAEADALAAAAPDEARSEVNKYLVGVLLWLLDKIAEDPAKEAVRRTIAALLVVLASFTQPAPLPPEPKALLPAAGTQALIVPGNWQIEGLPGVIRRAGPVASRRTLEFLAVEIRNLNTRQAYEHALMRFFNWCDDRNLELAEISPFAVMAYVEEMGREYAAPSVKQHLAAIRRLFDYLVVGQVLPMNPAALVRAPRPEVKESKTPVLMPKEARKLLDSIDTEEASGLRDRALLGVMLYSFARVSTVVSMNVEDYYRQGKHQWLRLREKGGKFHEVPAHHNAQSCLDAYLRVAGIADQKGMPLWRSMTKERDFGQNRMSRVDVFRMIKRRVRQAEISVAANCHTFRATGITAYLLNGGTIENAQAIAGHESPHSTKLYGRTGAKITPEEIERIGI